MANVAEIESKVLDLSTDFSEVVKTFATPLEEMDAMNKIISNAAGPIYDVINNSAFTELKKWAAELVAERTLELDKVIQATKVPPLNPAIFNLPMAGLPPEPDSKPLTIEPHPVEVVFPEEEPQPWLRRNWPLVVMWAISLAVAIYFGIQSLG